MNWFSEADEPTREAVFASSDAAFDYCEANGHLWAIEEAYDDWNEWKCSRCGAAQGDVL